MSTITYENIHVNGIPFQRILHLRISHAPNAHGRAEIRGLIPREQARRLAEQTDETTGIEITTDAKEQPQCLFYGVVSMLNIGQQSEYAVLDLVAETTSSRLSAKQNSRTFQNTGKTYGQILNQVLEGRGTVSVMVTDRPIGSMIMQCDETDWEFIIRMASQLGVPAFSNIIARTPQIYIGLPPSSRTKEIETLTYDYAKSNAEYQTAAAAMPEDFLRIP